MSVISADEVRVAHSKEVLVLNARRVLTCFDALDVDIANVVCFTLLIVEKDIDVLTVIHCRNHKLGHIPVPISLRLSFLICSSRLICLIFGTIAWSEIILAHVQGQNGVWHDRYELVSLSGDVVRLDLSTTLYINKHQPTAHASH